MNPTSPFKFKFHSSPPTTSLPLLYLPLLPQIPAFSPHLSQMPWGEGTGETETETSNLMLTALYQIYFTAYIKEKLLLIQ